MRLVIICVSVLALALFLGHQAESSGVSDARAEVHPLVDEVVPELYEIGAVVGGDARAYPECGFKGQARTEGIPFVVFGHNQVASLKVPSGQCVSLFTGEGYNQNKNAPVLEIRGPKNVECLKGMMLQSGMSDWLSSTKSYKMGRCTTKPTEELANSVVQSAAHQAESLTKLSEMAEKSAVGSFGSIAETMSKGKHDGVTYQMHRFAAANAEVMETGMQGVVATDEADKGTVAAAKESVKPFPMEDHALAKAEEKLEGVKHENAVKADKAEKVEEKEEKAESNIHIPFPKDHQLGSEGNSPEEDAEDIVKKNKKLGIKDPPCVPSEGCYPPTPPCEDKNRHEICLDYVAEGKCNLDMVKRDCQKSCGLCPPPAGVDVSQASLGASGHYYLGPNRRRVGAGFGRRRRSPTAAPTKAPTAPPTEPPAPGAKADALPKPIEQPNRAAAEMKSAATEESKRATKDVPDAVVEAAGANGANATDSKASDAATKAAATVNKEEKKDAGEKATDAAKKDVETAATAAAAKAASKKASEGGSKAAVEHAAKEAAEAEAAAKGAKDAAAAPTGTDIAAVKAAGRSVAARAAKAAAAAATAKAAKGDTPQDVAASAEKAAVATAPAVADAAAKSGGAAAPAAVKNEEEHVAVKVAKAAAAAAAKAVAEGKSEQDVHAAAGNAAAMAGASPADATAAGEAAAHGVLSDHSEAKVVAAAAAAAAAKEAGATHDEAVKVAASAAAKVSAGASVAEAAKAGAAHGESASRNAKAADVAATATPAQAEAAAQATDGAAAAATKSAATAESKAAAADVTAAKATAAAAATPASKVLAAKAKTAAAAAAAANTVAKKADAAAASASATADNANTAATGATKKIEAAAPPPPPPTEAQVEAEIKQQASKWAEDQIKQEEGGEQHTGGSA